MPTPGITRLQDGARLHERLQGIESLKQNGSLLLYLEGLPQGISERVAKEEGPRRLHLARDLFLQRNPDGRNALGLDGALEQAHGLVAEASGWGQKDGLGAIAL